MPILCLTYFESLYIAAQENTKNKNTDNGVKEIIVTADDGTKYVNVDKTIVSINDTAKEITGALKSILNEKFNGFVNVKGQRIGINNRTVNEWQHSKNAESLLKNNKQAFTDKMNSFNNADEILEIAKNYINEEIKHKRKDNFKEFARGVVDIKVGNNGYSADVIVGTTKNGVALLYDIVNLTQKEIVDTSTAAQNRREETHTTNNIHDNSENVNGKFSIDNNIDYDTHDFTGGKYSLVGEERFSLSEPVEETKDLVAVHNVNEEKLLEALELGGMPMPSIAVTRVNKPHNDFGKISLIFNSETIDPQKNKANKVYGGDAYTPMRPEPVFKPNEKVIDRISKKYQKLSEKYGSVARPLYKFSDEDNAQIYLSRENGEKNLIQKLLQDRNMQEVFLADNGIIIEPIYKEETKTLSVENQKLYDYIISELENEAINDFGNNKNNRREWLKKHKKEFINAYEKGLVETLDLTEEEVKDTLNSSGVADLLSRVMRYYKKGAKSIETKLDLEKMNAKFDEVFNKSKYQKWLENLFGGIEDGKFLRVESVEKGGVDIKLNNGDVIDVYNADFGNNSLSDLINYGVQIDGTAATANAFIGAFNGSSQSVESYALNFNEVYTKAKSGISLQAILSNKGIVLNESAKKVAYKLAQLNASEEAKQKENAKKSTSEAYFDDSAIQGMTLTKKQKNAVLVAEVISKVLNVNVKLFVSGVDEQGNKIGENGSYNADTNTISIDVDAGINNISESGLNGAMLRTLSHELTHHFESLQKGKTSKEYKEFQQTVFESKAFKKWVKTYSSIKAEQIEGSYNSLDEYREAMAELYETKDKSIIDCEITATFVADNLFKDDFGGIGRLATELKGTKRQRFVSFMKNIFKKFKGAISGINKLEKRFESLYGAAKENVQNKNTDNGVKKYDIVTLENGKTYVRASENRNVITGKTLSERRADITKFFNSLLDENGKLDIETEEGDILTLTKKETANKARDNYKTVNGKRIKMSDDEFLVKLHAETHIDELAKTSKKFNSASDTKQHSFAKDGFTYRTAYFEDYDGSFHKITLSIGNDGKTATVYNVGQIKKDSLPSETKIVSVEGSKPRGKLSYTNSISENNENVNRKYSLEKTTDNKAVVVIDENILDGVAKKDWVKTVKKVISEKFSNGIPIGNRLIKVNKVTKNEFANSKYTHYLKTTDGTIYADKYKSANNLDEIVLATTNYINEDLKHERKDNFKEFARGEVLLRVGNNDYKANVIVGTTKADNMVLYDIINFKTTNFDIKKEALLRTEKSQKVNFSRNAGSASTNSISENNENVNTQFEARDTEYMQAVEKGDTETAQKLVDDVAMQWGAYSEDGKKPLKLYHGTTNQEETRVWNSKARSYDTTYTPIRVFKKQYGKQVGHFFNDDIDNAGGYGSFLYSVYLKIDNPLIIDCNGQNYGAISFDGKEMDTYEWADYAKKKRYDGVIFKNISDGVDYNALSKLTTDYVVFYPNQIKSADPVTYDDNGNVIPLSERFKEDNADIRYSLEKGRDYFDIDENDEVTYIPK